MGDNCVECYVEKEFGYIPPCGASLENCYDVSSLKVGELDLTEDLKEQISGQRINLGISQLIDDCEPETDNSAEFVVSRVIERDEDNQYVTQDFEYASVEMDDVVKAMENMS